MLNRPIKVCAIVTLKCGSLLFTADFAAAAVKEAYEI